MPTKSLLLLFPLSFLLLLVNPPLAASVECWYPGLDHPPDHPTVDMAGGKVPPPKAADCLHIASILPSSLWFDPAIQASHRKLTLSYGPLSKHRFDLPAVIRHKSCEVLIRGRTHNQAEQARREFTREDTAYYFWNTFKAEIERIVRQCIMGTGKKGGVAILTEKLGETGLPDGLKNSIAVIMVYPTGSQRVPREDTNLYNV